MFSLHEGGGELVTAETIYTNFPPPRRGSEMEQPNYSPLIPDLKQIHHNWECHAGYPHSSYILKFMRIRPGRMILAFIPRLFPTSCNLSSELWKRSTLNRKRAMDESWCVLIACGSSGIAYGIMNPRHPLIVLSQASCFLSNFRPILWQFRILGQLFWL